MNEKNLTMSVILQQHEALKKRLIENHPAEQEIEEKLKILHSGFRGEKNLKYFLSLIPEKNYFIFHNLRLPHGNSHFEIDALLISFKTIIIIDVKNFAGSILIEKYQLTQEVNDTKKIYPNPLTQANRHRILLRYFFEKNNIPLIPDEYLVCIGSSTTITQIAPGYADAEKRVFKAENLLIKIQEIEKLYKKEVLDPKVYSKLKKLLLNQDTPLRIEILNKYGIHKNEIKTGVQCPTCFHIPMTYKGRNWECPVCKSTSKDAHISAINDYFLLIHPSLTNSELRHFLHLPTSRSATYLLSFLNLPHTDTRKGRIYHSPQSSIHDSLRLTNNKKNKK